jgi:putative transposase
MTKMPFDAQGHQRCSIRLPGYDYASPGAYFVTLVTWQRECLFGEIVNDEMIMNPTGRVVKMEWQRLGYRFPNLRPEAFVIMPNHVHGIIVIMDPVRATRGVPIVGATRGVISVGATRPSSDQALVRNDRLPDESCDCIEGSPLPPGDGSPLPVDDGSSVSGGDGSPISVDDGSSPRRTRPDGPAPGSIGAIIGQFKSRVTKRLRSDPKLASVNIWQRNYYEHIIRNEGEWERIRQYILDNPRRWAEDDEYV